MNLDLSLFEPFMGKRPYRVINLHPQGQFVALQVWAKHPQNGRNGQFCAIWESATGKIVWTPEHTIAMAWGPDGNEIGMLREWYEYNSSAHQIIGSPLQNEFIHTWERRAWPDKRVIHTCRIQMPTGWLIRLFSRLAIISRSSSGSMSASRVWSSSRSRAREIFSYWTQGCRFRSV